MDTDRDWELWGRKDPYFGVLTDPRYRKENLTDDARATFFASGDIHVHHVLGLAERVAPGLQPRRILDFGCGVGRLVLAFAANADEVVGVDVSEAMLIEAGRNGRERGLTNITLCKSDDELSLVQGPFDLVHTAIVLQHIPPERGNQIFRELVARIRPGGVGVIQVTYAKAWFGDTYGKQPAPKPPIWPLPKLEPATVARSKRWFDTLRPRREVPKPVPRVEPGVVPAAAQPEAQPGADPAMHMNSYDMDALLYMVQKAGAASVQLDFTDHGGELGAFMAFRIAS